MRRPCDKGESGAQKGEREGGYRPKWICDGAVRKHWVMTDATRPSADNKVGWGGWKMQWV